MAFGMAAASGTLIAYSGPDYAKLKALLPPGPDAALCLSRTYDADHLNKHKQQQVTALVLLIRYVVLSDDDAILVATEDGGIRKQHFRYDFTLAAKVRDRRETLYAERRQRLRRRRSAAAWNVTAAASRSSRSRAAMARSSCGSSASA
ncbi:hypothetical protein AUC69_09240 [Methyloceanibacter superfactus]|uniref:Uncharacterized protein n=1 Tax=Methyloceanibacter superfactus TaxID=1774969 RepID=A0A1E3W1Z6_9HYPH|nr:hypothetical protein AUC69_09240 [Methyloceanibacter superfactus]